MTALDAAARAHLDSLKAWDAMTPEERAEEATRPHRRDVLGSLDDTHALNHSERGSMDALATVGTAVAFSPTFFAHWLGYWWTGALMVAAALVVVAVACCVQAGRVNGGAR